MFYLRAGLTRISRIGGKKMAKFKKGQGGRPKGVPNYRTSAWEDLKEAIIDSHAGRFNQILANFMDSEDPIRQEKGCELFLRAIEYFKPKQARITHAGDQEAPIQIIVGENI